MENITNLLDEVQPIEPAADEILNLSSLVAEDRITLMKYLKFSGVKRITIDRGFTCETLKQMDDRWRLTCRNVPY